MTTPRCTCVCTCAASTTTTKPAPRARKASAGDGGLYARRLVDGSTVYDVSWTERTPLGKPVRRQKRGFPTMKEAAAFRRAVTAGADRGDTAQTTGLLPTTTEALGAFLDRWLKVHEAKPQTLAGYRIKTRLHISPHLGHLKLTEVTTAHLDALYVLLRDQGSPGGQGPLGPASIRQVHQILSAAFSYAISHDLLETNPCKKAHPPSPKQVKRARPRTRLWTTEQLRHFLSVTAEDDLGPLWRLYAISGARRGELLGLRWADVDLERGLAVVHEAVAIDRPVDSEGKPLPRALIFGTTKDDEPRDLWLDPDTIDVLRRHRRRQTAERMLHADRWTDHDLVFAKTTGRGDLGGPLHPEKVSAAFQTARQHAGLPHTRLHDLRHGWVALAKHLNLPVTVAKDQLGHSSLAMTAGVYDRYNAAVQRDAVQRVADLLA